MVFTLFSCQNDSRPTEIYNDYYSNLALVENNYYYTITYGDDRRQYITIDGNNIKIHDYVRNAIENINKKVGIGFFISKDGRIVTHKDLINLQNKLPIIKEKLDERINDSVLNYRQKINSLKSGLLELVNYYDNHQSDLTEKRKDVIIEKYYARVDSIESIKEKIDDIEKESFTLGVVNYDIRVSKVNGNNFESSSSLEFIASNEPDIKRKYTGISFLKPMRPNIFTAVKNIYLKHSALSRINKNDLVHIFTIKRDNTANPKYSPIFVKDVRIEDLDDTSLELNDKRVKFMPGSPIISSQGELIGVSDISSQRAIRTKSLYTGISYREIIVKFLAAEDERDLKKIESFFASHTERYYDKSNLSFDDLIKTYKYAWSTTRKSKNDVLRIEKIDNYNFNVTVKFSYFSIKNKKTLSRESKVRYNFDHDGKITKIYKI